MWRAGGSETRPEPLPTIRAAALGSLSVITTHPTRSDHAQRLGATFYVLPTRLSAWLRSRPGLSDDEIFTRLPVPLTTPAAFDVIAARLPGLGLSSSGRGRTVLVSSCVSVIAVFCGHVPGRPFTADPGSRVPKGPAGRSRGLHAPCDEQEGPVPGLCGRHSWALLAGRPAELAQLAVSSGAWEVACLALAVVSAPLWLSLESSVCAFRVSEDKSATNLVAVLIDFYLRFVSPRSLHSAT